jgi:hypothetical protein
VINPTVRSQIAKHTSGMNLDEQEINQPQVIDDQVMPSSFPVKMLLKI